MQVTAIRFVFSYWNLHKGRSEPSVRSLIKMVSVGRNKNSLPIIWIVEVLEIISKLIVCILVKHSLDFSGGNVT